MSFALQRRFERNTFSNSKLSFLRSIPLFFKPFLSLFKAGQVARRGA
jgi:hypothetical protein